MKDIVAIIQARLASSRLPGKVLQEIAKKTMLEWVVDRTRKSSLIRDVIIATTVNPSDDELFEFCIRKGYLVERGSEYDVLDRYYKAAVNHKAEVIVRVTADCPFIDPILIDQAIRLIVGVSEADLQNQKRSLRFINFVANRLPPPWGRTYPIGLDVEVFTFAGLLDAWQNAVLQHQREHVAPYFYEDAQVEDLVYKASHVPYAFTVTPKGYKIALMHHSPDYGHLRWTVDTPKDLELVRYIASYFSCTDFHWEDVLNLVQQHPELSQINAHVQHKTHLDVDQRSP